MPRFTQPLIPNADAALRIARERSILPTALDTFGIREAFSQDVLQRSVFSASTTHARYLQSVEKQIEAVLAGRDPKHARTILKGMLTRWEYDPETGFPGDAELGIPPARPGSIRDLRSNARLDLIIDTQVKMLTGRAQQIAGSDAKAMHDFPAWELVRVEARRMPRDWRARWKQAGGSLVKDTNGRMRMVALKDAEIWSLLGDPAFFGDAIGISHPPFAFRSGMGWRAITRAQCIRMKLIKRDGTRRAGEGTAKAKKKAKAKPAPKLLPPATFNTETLSPRMRKALLDALGSSVETSKAKGRGKGKGGRVSMKGTLATDAFVPPPPPPSRSAALLARARSAKESFNALLLAAEVMG